MVSPSIDRSVGSGQILSTQNGDGVSLLIDLTNFPQASGLITVMAGDVWNFQYWFRDAGSVSNLTDGLPVGFD